MKPTATIALIDGDVFAYRVAAASETVIDLPDGTALLDADLNEAQSSLDSMLGDIADRLGANRTLVAVSTARCFRYDVLPTYKHNRREVRKPILLRGLKDYLVEKYGAKTKPKLEADDVLGIWATMPSIKGRKVIVTIDKDLKQIPGYFFNPMKDEAAQRITPEAADHFHLMQTLMGDVTDGYKGCPGIGPKKAAALLDKDYLWQKYMTHYGDETAWQRAAWESIVATYQSKSLTEDDALQQARVARICRATDFNFETQEPILWTPQA